MEAVPEHVLTFQPPERVVLDKKLYLEALRKTPRGSAAGLTGLRFEHLRALLDNEGHTDLLYTLLQTVARAEVPQDAATVLRTGSLVALRRKRNSGRRNAQKAGSKDTCETVRQRTGSGLRTAPVRPLHQGRH